MRTRRFTWFGPTTRIWDLAGKRRNLKAVFLECTFPDHMSELAEISAHLTPSTFQHEVAKLPAGVTVYAVHIKPRYREEVIAGLRQLGIPNVEIGVSGKEYSF